MRLPITVLLAVLVSAPAVARPVAAPTPSAEIVQPANILPVQAPSSLADGRAQSAASDTPAVFSEPTEPVPLLPSQRKLLRMRKV